jgi:hypothetical protein
MDNNHKLNYLFKKALNKPSTLINDTYFQEPSIIFTNNINTNYIYAQKSLCRDNISTVLDNTLLNATLDNNGDLLIGSIIGKTLNNVTKYEKVEMSYVYGSMIKNSLNQITSIAFFLKELQNSLSFTFDVNGSYKPYVYRYDTNSSTYILVNHSIGEYIIDHDTGVLTFYDKMNTNYNTKQHITNLKPPYISFYKYSGNYGLYPIIFNNNSSVTANCNFNVKNNIIIDNNCTVKNKINILDSAFINNNLSLSGIFFNKLSEFPNNSTNKLVNISNELYFNTSEQWIKISNNNDIASKSEQYIFNHNTIYNILNVNTNVSIIEITQNLISNIYVILPLVQQTGIEKTIIIGQSFNKYRNRNNIILYSKFMDVDGNGPVFMNINFVSTGQSIKLMSVCANNENIYGYNNKYWQIMYGHFNSNDNFEFVGDTIINTNDKNTVFHANVNDIQYNSLTSISQVPQNVLFNTFYINVDGINTLDLSASIILIELTTNLTENITINLPVESISGEKKTIIIGSSFETYKSTYHIELKSTYLGGYNIEFLSNVSEKNIKFIKSGQSITLLSITSTISYYQILSGDYTII